MVYYYETSCGHTVYVGRDKFENEDLLKYGLVSDLWFHVDNLSSAHVYLRLEPGETIDEVSEHELMECAVLTKANSIKGCKLDSVTVVYTSWDNLLKNSSMDDGQVGFKSAKKVRKVLGVKKDNVLVNRYKKMRTEENGVKHLIENKKQYERAVSNLAKQKKKQPVPEPVKTPSDYYAELYDSELAAQQSNHARMYDPEEDFW